MGVAWSDLANRQARPSTAHTHPRARVESAAAARSAAVLFAAAAREPLVTRIMISRNGSRTRQKNVVVEDLEWQGLRGCQPQDPHQHQQHWAAMVTRLCVLAAVLQMASAGQSAQDIMDRYGQYIDLTLVESRRTPLESVRPLVMCLYLGSQRTLTQHAGRCSAKLEAILSKSAFRS